MPRHAQPPHIVYIKPRHHKETGKLLSRGYWAIKDRNKLISTGYSFEERDQAERKRHEYEVTLYSKTPLPQGNSVHDVLVVDVIRFYIERRAKWIADKPDRRRKDYLNTVERLIRYWDGKTVAEINEDTCAEYQAKSRPGKPLTNQTARRELEDLRAMINLGVKKRKVILNGWEVDWELPEKAEARTEHFTRREVAKLVRTALFQVNKAIGGPNGHRTSVHIARFILIATYTGSRADCIERATWDQVEGRPWMDLESKIFYRASKGKKVPRNKRANPCRIPKPLLRLLVRWRNEDRKKGTNNVIEHDGDVGQTRRAFYSLKFKVFSEERARLVNRHTLRHTCATWLMAAGLPIAMIAKYLSDTPEMIEERYGHHHPDYHSEVDDAFTRGRAGREPGERAPFQIAALYDNKDLIEDAELGAIDIDEAA